MSAAAAAARRPAPSRPWTHYVNDHFFDRPDLDPGLERLAFRLERLARDRAWCVTSNDELMDLLGCSHNTLAALLNRGESLGWFRRVLVPGRHGRATGRLAIVLFVRPTDRDVATPETFDQVVDLIRAEIRRGSPPGRAPRTLPFPAPIPRESANLGPQNLGTADPRNWGPPVPKNWGPSSYSKEGITGQETETTTTAMHGASVSTDTHALPGSSSFVSDSGPETEETGTSGAVIPGECIALQPSAAGTSTHLPLTPSAPVEVPPAVGVPAVAAELPAELVTAAAEAIPEASGAWVSSLLRDCGGYGLELALLVLAWVKARRPDRPGRYARTALSGWLNRLRAGELTMADVQAEVHGRPVPRSSPRPFDPSVCLARLAIDGWTIAPQGPNQVIRMEIPGRDATSWRHVASDLRQQIEEHKAELKAYVLKRAAERGKTVGLRA
jgi:hypothetical protein